MFKTYKQTAIVSFESNEPVDPLHIEHFLNAAIRSEVPRYQPFDPLGRIDRNSVKVLAISEEPEEHAERYCNRQGTRRPTVPST